MTKDIFSYIEYRKYLKDEISSRPKRGHGVRMAMARSIQCPPSHVSQILSAVSHLSLEQAESLNEFLAHPPAEADYFLLLVQLARAGTPSLRRRLERQKIALLAKRVNLREQLQIEAGLTTDQQTTFYSSWLYGAVHVMLSIPRLQNKEALSRHLGVSSAHVDRILSFLISTGLASKHPGGGYEIGKTRIHLGAESPLISRFHSLWRMQALRSLEREDFERDLHYSSVVTLSREDRDRIHSRLIQEIQAIKEVIRASPEEEVHCFSVDWFRL